MMLFKDRHIEQIRSGSKTVTRREWADNYAGLNVGTVTAAKTEMLKPESECDCFVRVLDVYEQALHRMTDADAQQEGNYETVAEFREGYEDVYGADAWDPGKVVTVVEFEYVGRERPDRQETLVASGGDA